MDDDRTSHRAFLDRLYGPTRQVYDATRRLLLPGRDALLAELLREPWTTLLEIGPGTGRNLRKLHAARPAALLGGLDASGAMLAHARARCPWARLAAGFAEDADLGSLLDGMRPARVLFSYSLSMMQDPAAALANARTALAPGGSIAVVDFADMARIPGIARRGLRGWLRTFHVSPLEQSLFAPFDAGVRFGPGRYFLVAHIASGTER